MIKGMSLTAHPLQRQILKYKPMKVKMQIFCLMQMMVTMPQTHGLFET